MDQLGFEHILILLGGAVVFVALFRFLRLPQILAYLFVGILLGPHGLGVIPEAEGTRYLAEFGLVFLMFTIGLEFSLPQLLAMKRTVLLFGGAQVFVTGVLFAMLARAVGVAGPAAVIAGGALALSSTAVVMKLLIEQLEQNSRHGRQAFGILLFQDLIVVPFLVLIPALATGNSDGVLDELVWVTVKGGLLVAAFIAVGHWLLRRLLHHVAATRSPEFFVLSLLAVVLLSAWLTDIAGLSLALGAFLAGLLIGETEYRHQVEVDILPFRDILLGLFFVTTGMLLDIRVVVALLPWVLLVLTLIVLVKGALIYGLGRWFGVEPGVALRTGLVLSAGGEFSFALLTQAARSDVLTGQPAQVILAAVVLSIVLAPLVIRYNGDIARRLFPSYSERREADLDAIRAEAQTTRPDVIICGYGRSGQNLAFMLSQEGIPVLALDLDPVRVRDARDAGEPVVYGDCARRDVLDAAGVQTARALAITFTDTPAELRILEITRTLRPDMPVIVRTKDDADLERLNAAGATEVVPESLEGSLMIASHVLLLLDVAVSHIVRRVAEVRRDRYRMLRGFFHGTDIAEEGGEAYQMRLHSVALPSGAFAVGRLLADLKLRERGVMVTAVRRGGIRGPEPAPYTRLEAGDVLVLYGTPESLHVAENALLRG